MDLDLVSVAEAEETKTTDIASFVGMIFAETCEKNKEEMKKRLRASFVFYHLVFLSFNAKLFEQMFNTWRILALGIYER